MYREYQLAYLRECGCEIEIEPNSEQICSKCGRLFDLGPGASQPRYTETGRAVYGDGGTSKKPVLMVVQLSNQKYIASFQDSEYWLGNRGTKQTKPVELKSLGYIKPIAKAEGYLLEIVGTKTTPF